MIENASTERLKNERIDYMGAQGSKSLKNFVAITKHYLYYSGKVLEADRQNNGAAIVRAILLVAISGSAIWYVLWKLAAHFFFAR